jgi:hypothetical protein
VLLVLSTGVNAAAFILRRTVQGGLYA